MRAKNHAIIGIDVYLEKRKSREHVGRLEKIGAFFVLTYSEQYIYGKSSIPLGPDLQLSKQIHKSKVLFASFEDRLPSKQNAAYEEYCSGVGISPSETDPFILLSTLGKSGPSSFRFVAVTKGEESSIELKKFRQELHLTVREFADLFDFATSTVSGIETKRTSGKDALKRISIYISHPETALSEALKNNHKIHSDRWRMTEKILREKIKKK
jgi:HipA-like protein